MESIEKYLSKPVKWKGEKKNFKVNPEGYSFLQQFTQEHEFPDQSRAFDYIIKTFQAFFKSNGKATISDDSKELIKAAQQAQHEAEEKAEQLTTQLAEKDTEITTLTGERDELKTEIEKWTESYTKVFNRVVEEYPQIKEGTGKGGAIRMEDVFDQLIAHYKTQSEGLHTIAADALQREDYKKLKAELEAALPMLFKKKYKLNNEQVSIDDEIFLAMLVKHATTDKSSIFPDQNLAEKAITPYIIS